MKTVLDTNVVISGLLVPDGPPGRIVDLWANGKIILLISSALIEECLDVFLRPKFSKAGTTDDRRQLFEQLISLKNTFLVIPKTMINAIHQDPDDNRVLECAIAGAADYIISGDKHLLDLQEFEGIPVITPNQFLAVNV